MKPDPPSHGCSCPIPPLPAHSQVLLLPHSPWHLLHPMGILVPRPSVPASLPLPPLEQSKIFHMPSRCWHPQGPHLCQEQSTAVPRAGLAPHPAQHSPVPGANSPLLAVSVRAGTLQLSRTALCSSSAHPVCREDTEEQGQHTAPPCPIPVAGRVQQGGSRSAAVPCPGCSRVTGDLERLCCGGCISHGLRAQRCPGTLPRARLFVPCAPTVPTRCCRGKGPLGSADPRPDWV